MGSRRVLIVCAPDVPPSEITFLEEHFRKALADPDFVVVVNYNVYVASLDYGDQTSLAISAPDIPPAELAVLRKKIDDPTTDLIVVNYIINFQSFS